MIGTLIRSTHHLSRIVKAYSGGVTCLTLTQPKVVLEHIVFNAQESTNGVIVLTKRNNIGFKQPMNCGDRAKQYVFGQVCPTESKALSECFHNNNIVFVNVINTQLHDRTGFGNLAICLPNNFEEDYQNFITANKKITSSINDTYLRINSETCKFIYCVCDGNLNFFAWACKMYAKHRVNLYTLYHLMLFNQEHKGMVKMLPKGNLLALNNSKDMTSALRESFFLMAKETAKQIINVFNTTQKKMLRERIDNTEVIYLLNNFSKLSKVKRLNFIKKVSTIDNCDEILNLMRFLCSHTHFAWNQESLLDFINNADGINCNVIINRPNLVVVKVNDFETMKRLGKTTNWCISKNRQYWDNYMHQRHNDEVEMDEEEVVGELERTPAFIALAESDSASLHNSTSRPQQFMIFDFTQKEDTPLSIVGVTCNAIHGINHAHNFVNASLMGLEDTGVGRVNLIERGPSSLYRHFTSWTVCGQAKPVNKQSIRKIDSHLKRLNLSVNDFIAYHYSRCDWNKDSAINYLNSFVSSDDYIILYESNDKILLRSNRVEISAILPNIFNYYNLVECDTVGHIWFLDFSKDKNDINKIIYWPIHTNDYEIEIIGNHPYNEVGDTIEFSFNALLRNLNLPFDIIKRPDSVTVKLSSSLHQEDYIGVETILASIKRNKNLKLYLDDDSQSIILRWLHMSIIDCRSLEFLNTITDNDISLTTFLDKSKMYRLPDLILQKMHTIAEQCSETVFSQFTTDKQDLMVKITNIVNNIDDIPNINYKDLSPCDTDMLGYNYALYTIIKDVVRCYGNEIIFSMLHSLIISTSERVSYLQPSDIHGEHIKQQYINLIASFINQYHEEMSTPTFNDMAILFQLTAFRGFDDFVLDKFEEYLDKNALTPSKMSRIIDELENVAFKDLEVRHKIYNTLTNKAVEQQVISVETAAKLTK